MTLWVTCDLMWRVAQQHQEVDSSIDVSQIEAVVKQYNDSLVFGASEDKMAYTIRDPLTSGRLY